MQSRSSPKPSRRFFVHSADSYGAATLVAAVNAVYVAEGVKAVEARRRLGFPEPMIEGKPLSSIASIGFATADDILTFSLLLGRRAGLGAYWLHLSLPGAPEEAKVSDRDFQEALRMHLQTVEA